MRYSRPWSLALALGALLIRPAVGHAITVAQVDDFQAGTTQGWTNGAGGASLANIAGGGPAGALDRYLQVSSGSFGSVPNLITFNSSQWTGNYALAGVTQIAMDLKNFGTSALPIRIAIRESSGAGYSSSDGVAGGAFILPVDNAWHHWEFSLSASALAAIGAPQPLATELTAVPQLRLLSSAVASTSGDLLNAQIGVDNITAVPEPATLLTAALGFAVLLIYRCRRSAGRDSIALRRAKAVFIVNSLQRKHHD